MSNRVILDKRSISLMISKEAFEVFKRNNNSGTTVFHFIEKQLEKLALKIELEDK